ncbi:hypothetical protein CDIK_1478 [Cucumispora dikerogammari]|nr:hypothetical protein CDIK_1478 [Cucumispora dikerogammari]
MVFQKWSFKINQPKVTATENDNLSEASSGNEPLIVFEDESLFLPSDIDYFKNDGRNTDSIKKNRIELEKKAWFASHVSIDQTKHGDRKHNLSEVIFSTKNENINYFFQESFIEYIYRQTNKSAQQERRKNKTIEYITKNELTTFIWLLYYMGVDSLPNLKLYWIKEDDQIVNLRRSYVFEKMSMLNSRIFVSTFVLPHTSPTNFR